MNVLRQAALLFFMSSGLTLVVITAGLDLSIGATIGLAACVAGTVIKSTGDPWLGVAAALGIGASVGLLNGMMVSLLRIPSFIATYGMLWVLQGLTYTFMAGATVYGFPRGFRAARQRLFARRADPRFGHGGAARRRHGFRPAHAYGASRSP